MNVSGHNNNNSQTVSFGAMKKSQFSGIDFAVVEKFKAPIETFNSVSDFEKWAKEQFVECCGEHPGRKKSVTYQRQKMVDNWSYLLNNSCGYTPAERYLIINGVTRDLKPNNDAICPAIDRETLNKTMAELKEKLSKNERLLFSFSEMYKKNLKDKYMECMNVSKDTTGWIVIPSKENDPENFRRNVQTLQSLSAHEWCTKHGGADYYLNEGDMHIYMENGKPKLAIRFTDDVIDEINGELNDRVIPKEYIGILDDYIKTNDFLMMERPENDLNASRKLAEQLSAAEEAVETVPQQPASVVEKKGVIEKIRDFLHNLL